MFTWEKRNLLRSIRVDDVASQRNPAVVSLFCSWLWEVFAMLFRKLFPLCQFRKCFYEDADMLYVDMLHFNLFTVIFVANNKLSVYQVHASYVPASWSKFLLSSIFQSSPAAHIHKPSVSIKVGSFVCVRLPVEGKRGLQEYRLFFAEVLIPSTLWRLNKFCAFQRLVVSVFDIPGNGDRWRGGRSEVSEGAQGAPCVARNWRWINWTSVQHGGHGLASTGKCAQETLPNTIKSCLLGSFWCFPTVMMSF